MTLEQIHYFVTVAKHLNFTHAAAELQISQATLSRQISAMENELNLILFQRDNRNVSLTTCGNYLYSEYGKLYDNYRIISENAKRIFAGYNGNLTIGVLEESTLQGKMEEAIFHFSTKHSNLNWTLKRGSFRALKDGLLDGSLDAIVTLLFDIADNTSFQYKIIEHGQDGILISARNPKSRYKTFNPEKFKDETFIIMSEADSPIAAEQAISYCRQYGFYPKLRMAPDLDTAMLWVEAGLGLAFSYDKAVSTLNPSMTFIPINPKTPIPHSTALQVLAWSIDNTNPALEQFLKEFS